MACGASKRDASSVPRAVVARVRSAWIVCQFAPALRPRGQIAPVRRAERDHRPVVLRKHRRLDHERSIAVQRLRRTVASGVEGRPAGGERISIHGHTHPDARVLEERPLHGCGFESRPVRDLEPRGVGRPCKARLDQQRERQQRQRVPDREAADEHGGGDAQRGATSRTRATSNHGACDEKTSTCPSASNE